MPTALRPRRARAAGPTWLGTLIDDHASAVLDLARRITGDDDEAENLACGVFRVAFADRGAPERARQGDRVWLLALTCRQALGERPQP